ncbi:MAG: hypothetical protein JXA25_07140 [Anaerolineales bacterium]|nr:hypothetical protein [Anaerolineales bacterium]
MIYLDTHIVVWLYAGLLDRFTESGKALLNQNDLVLSPIVRLELQYLFEIGRILVSPDTILSDLAGRMGLSVCDKDFNMVVSQTLKINWTRDPFDRLIVAQASVNENLLLTKDPVILEHYSHACRE